MTVNESVESESHDLGHVDALDESKYVVPLQALLYRCGHWNKSLDGKVSEELKLAVQNFEEPYNLPSIWPPSGQTWAQLAKVPTIV